MLEALLSTSRIRPWPLAVSVRCPYAIEPSSFFVALFVRRPKRQHDGAIGVSDAAPTPPWVSKLYAPHIESFLARNESRTGSERWLLAILRLTWNCRHAA